MSEPVDASARIERITELPFDASSLAAAARSEGFEFPARLVEDWIEGSNRFDGSGEAFFGARVAEELVGCCGLNIDPYIDDARVGRVRHLYIEPTYRRRGIATELVEEVIRAARASFVELRLRTRNPKAAVFYEAIGFDAVRDDEFCTHRMRL